MQQEQQTYVLRPKSSEIFPTVLSQFAQALI